MSPGGFQICSWPVHQGALDQRSNEFALLDSFARPVAVAVVAVRRPSGRAGAEAAMDAAPLAVLHRGALARHPGAVLCAATWNVVHGCVRIGARNLVHRLSPKKMAPPGAW